MKIITGNAQKSASPLAVPVTALLVCVFVLAAFPVTAQNTSEPIDLTSTGDDETTTTTSQTQRVPASTGLTVGRHGEGGWPGATGVPASGGYGRLWGEASHRRVGQIAGEIPMRPGSAVIERYLTEVMLSDATPLDSPAAIRAVLIDRRFAWLRPRASADALGAIVGERPGDDVWDGWRQWLVLDRLIGRDDTAACRYVASEVAATLDAFWHKAGAFCQVIAGETSKAQFALDILGEDGLDDGRYFALMDRLIDSADGEIPPAGFEIAPADAALNLVLMDSVQINAGAGDIAAATEHASSMGRLRYLDPDGAALVAARKFANGNVDVAEVMEEWAGLPPPAIAAADALAEYSVATDGLNGGGPAGGDALALARLRLWQAVSVEADKAIAANIALRALGIAVGGEGYGTAARNLELWLPHLGAAGGGEQAGMLRGLGRDADPSALGGVASAWARILQLPTRNPVDSATLIAADALDAIPVLNAIGVATTTLDFRQQIENTRLASGEISLPYGRLDALAELNGSGNANQVEVVLLVAATLGETTPGALTRDDAARLVAGLHDAGMGEAARELAREILVGWAVRRFFADDAGANGTNNGDGA